MKKMKKTVTPKRLHLAKETVRILRNSSRWATYVDNFANLICQSVAEALAVEWPS